MIEIVTTTTILALVGSTLHYMRLYHKEQDKRLKYEVEVKDLILEHNKIADELQYNAYVR